ncbi:hypothetical protein LTR01_002573 [Friedmanniomyces endolithicus]|nr:hypothetical protein LTR01_002573 [Friedmanniomyces endolithicus]KAK0828975.1 hypothetical protein LTR73_004608 [Friedmanniomyces endolithicus]
MASPPQPQCSGGSFLDSLNCGSGNALRNSGTTVNALLAAIAGSVIAFSVQLLLFTLIRQRLSRIYRPRSYLVPERERVPPPPSGLIAWLFPLYTTSDQAFVQKCGLDAYFFLRYLRMLLKFFLPVALILLPILLPLNNYSGGLQKGLDKLSISNVAPRYMGSRLWAHLILAIGVIIWFCYVVYKELRGYIRVRQAFLTSPQHRLRASATTVLVTGIPRKWLTMEALSGLYDVFPGGIKNIWINRNFDELSTKVQLRATIAENLEGAELDLLKKCRTAHEKKAKEVAKKDGQHKKSKEQVKQDKVSEDVAAEQMAQEQGVSTGGQQATPRGLQDMLQQAEDQEQRGQKKESEKQHKTGNPLGMVGEGLDRVGLGAVNQGLGAVGHGFGLFGRGVGTLGQRVVGDVDDRVRNAEKGFDQAAYTGTGFVTDDELYRQSILSQSDGAPTPAPKTPALEREARLQANTESARDPLPGTVDDRVPADTQSKKTQPHPLSLPATVSAPQSQGSLASETTASGNPEIRTTRPSVESRPRSQMHIEEPPTLQTRELTWKVWKNNDRSLAMPSPQPHTTEEDEFPLNATSVRISANPKVKKETDLSASKLVQELAFWKKRRNAHGDEAKVEYPTAFNKDWDEDQEQEPRWRHYIEPKERDTIRLPVVDQAWFPALPFVGQKVDKIYWLRRELARLNVEIEADQNNVERFPFMNSAFIQFNHQIAAHMACQSLSHHLPQAMAPRWLEISPDDVLWDNLSIKWWERLLRTNVVLVICAGLIILYAIPVTFTSLLAHLNTLATKYTWLSWVARIPTTGQALIEGLLPPLLLNLILFLVPDIFRWLVHLQGVPTGKEKELGVQTWYFTFLFIQIFFIGTLASGLTSFFSQLATQPGQVFKSLSESLPRASTYFFQYLLVQALSNSSGALLQFVSLFLWFLFARTMDNTPRQKWRRQITLNNLQWGSFFPPFTNFAVIGIVYSVIAPFILFFMLIIFGLFWIVYRYNVLYVYQFRNDTGGLLFPTAVNQLFVGIYVMEICLSGYFFIARSPAGTANCIPQGAIMVAVGILTIIYQWLLNKRFNPLFRYLPITLEDEAVIRDEEFARAQESKFAPLMNQRDGQDEGEDDMQDALEEQERAETAESEMQVEQDLVEAAAHRRSTQLSHGEPKPTSREGSWKHTPPTSNSPTWKTHRWAQTSPEAVARLRHLAGAPQKDRPPTRTDVTVHSKEAGLRDVEAQQHDNVGDVLFAGFADELEDLTPDERDLLTRYAFQHAALRAKRPAIWIPRDRLGVSDDEIKRAERMSTVGQGGKANIWMTNQGAALNGEGKAVFRQTPPDFSSAELIAL